MANIILIEKDDRVRRQAEMYLAELGEENRIRSFKTLQEFESVYFRVVKVEEKKVAPFSTHPEFKVLAYEQQEWLVQQPLSRDSALPSSPLTFTVDPVTGKAKNLTPQPIDKAQILGTLHADFVTQEKVLENLLPVNFQHSFSDLLANVSQNGNADTLLAFYSPKNEVWIVRVQAKKSPDGIVFSLTDKTKSLNEVVDEIKSKNEESAKDEEEDEALRLLSDIDLVIIKAEFLPKKPFAWIDKFHANLKKFKLYPEKYRTRIVVLKYEDDGIEKVELTHPKIDDVIFIPLDRLIFLQKIEILLGLPGNPSQSFLFSQEAHMEIEIAKRSLMEKLSDVALAIRNPVPLVPGLLGHFFIDLPGEKTSLETFGKVIKSEAHPEHPNEFLVYFSFFSLRKDEQTRLRRFLSKDNHYVSLIDSEKDNFLFNPDNLFLSDEERRQKNIIVVDSDPESYSQALDILKEDVDHIQVAAFTSYSAFLRQYFEDTATPLDLSTLTPVLPKELGGGQITWIVDGEHKALQDISSLAPDSTILGFTKDELFKEKNDWASLFEKNGNEALIEEAISIAQSGRAFRTLVFALTKDMKQKALVLKVSSHPQGLEFNLSIPRNEEVKEFLLLQSKFTQWDLLVLDAALLPPDPTDWINNIEINAKAKGYLKEGQNLKIILVENPKASRDMSTYKSPSIRGLLMRPLEPRSFVFNVSTTLDLPYSIYSFKNMGWSSSRVTVQVAKKASLSRLSEFGGALKLPRPIAPGTFLYLRGSIYDNAPRGNLCARFYSCEEDQAEKGQYICSLIYFGINEAFTKFARSWFRETYAASKQNE